MNEQNGESFLVNRRELARLLSVSTRTLDRLDSSGRLPAALRLGGTTKRWRRDEIVEWVRQCMPDRKTWTQLREGLNGKCL